MKTDGEKNMSALRVIRLQAERFKRLSAVDITPQGDVVEVSGRNGAGKTSVLDAIWAALVGRAAPSEPVKSGHRSATIQVDLGEGTTVDCVVKRTFKVGGAPSLSVETNDGSVRSPQRFLDSLVGSIAFDPFGFMRAAPRAQAETLRSALGVDTSELDAERERVFSTRTEVGRDLRSVRARIDAHPNTAGYPKEAPNIADLSAELEAAMQADSDASRLAERIENGRAGVLERERHLAQMEASLAEAKEELAEWQRLLGTLQAEKRASKRLPPDIGAIRLRLSQASDVADKVRARQEHAALKKTMRETTDKQDQLTRRLEEIDSAKAKMLADTAMPGGVELGDDGLRLGGAPFEQASMAEQLRAAVEIAMISNPTIRVIRIADGSLLDDESMAEIRTLAGERGYQIWVERVAEGPGVGFYIEDGAIVDGEGE